MSDRLPAAANPNCPSCGLALPTGAVLCVHCGFHLRQGQHLATIIETEGDATAAAAASDNPYAAPISEQYVQRDQSLELSESTLASVRAIVRDAGIFPWMILFSHCACPMLSPVVLVLFPWSVARLAQGHTLRNRFELLRRPNSFSPHVNEAIAFQSALRRCWYALAWSGMLWIAVAIALFVRLRSQAS